MAHSEAVLRQGHALVLFPEGTRKEGLAVAPLHDGAMFVAARTGAKVVPVGIGGSDRAMPKGAKLPRPLKITIVVGAPSTAVIRGPCHSFGAQCQKRGTTRGLGEGVSPEPARLTALDSRVRQTATEAT